MTGTAFPQPGESTHYEEGIVHGVCGGELSAYYALERLAALAPHKKLCQLCVIGA